MYQIYVRDKSLNRVAQVEDYTSLEFIPRFNAIGSWVLDLPTDSIAAREIVKDQAGIIVVKNGVTLFSGPVKKPNRKWNMTQDTITVSGKDDNVHLLNLAYPEPMGAFATKDYDVRAGKAETIMKQYVDVNIGPNALSQRRELTLEVDKGLGSTVTGRGRFHTLLELFQSLALAGGDLGFRVIQVQNQLQFQVYQPADKTKSAFFNPLLGNLADFDYSVEAPEANFVIVGGGGEGVNRILLQKEDSASVLKYGRIESFIDRRDTEDIAELEQAMIEELVSKGEKKSLSITPIDTPQLMFGRDYNLGDKVSVVLPEETIQDVIREIKITLSPNGETISPVIGTPESVSGAFSGFFNRLNKLAKRVSHIERV